MFRSIFLALLIAFAFVLADTKITCANVRCASKCIDTPEGPECTGRFERSSPPHPCAFTKCPTALKCIALEGRAACVQF